MPSAAVPWRAPSTSRRCVERRTQRCLARPGPVSASRLRSSWSRAKSSGDSKQVPLQLRRSRPPPASDSAADSADASAPSSGSPRWTRRSRRQSGERHRVRRRRPRPAQRNAARLAGVGLEGTLVMDSLLVSGRAMTDSADEESVIPDSTAAGAALATGVQDVRRRRRPRSAHSNPVTTLIERAEAQGKVDRSGHDEPDHRRHPRSVRCARRESVAGDRDRATVHREDGCRRPPRRRGLLIPSGGPRRVSRRPARGPAQP